MGQSRQLTWFFDEGELIEWMTGREVQLVSVGKGNTAMPVTFLVDEDRHQEILGLDEPLTEDEWDD